MVDDDGPSKPRSKAAWDGAARALTPCARRRAAALAFVPVFCISGGVTGNADDISAEANQSTTRSNSTKLAFHRNPALSGFLYRR